MNISKEVKIQMIIDILLAVSIGAPIEEKISSNHMKKRSKASFEPLKI